MNRFRAPRPVLARVLPILLLSVPAALGAQSAGSILGQITDTEDQPLGGARVSIVSPPLSTLTGTDGRFVLGAVPGGEHTLRVELLGRESVRVEHVRVGIGRVTEVRIRMEAAAVPVKPLEVTAERVRLIEPEVSMTHEVMTGRELRELPVDRVDQILSLTTGVTDGHFRGGRLGQETYVVDGLSVKNQVESSARGATLEYSPSALEEVEVVTGGFGAEYGSALSGVVSYLTRRGSREHWEGRASLRGDGRLPGSTGFTALSLSAGGPLDLLGAGSTLFGDVLAQGMADADPRARGLGCLAAVDVPSEIAARLHALRADPHAAALYCPYSPSLLPHDAGDKLIGFLRLDRPAGPVAVSATLLGNRLQRQLYTPELKYNRLYQLGQRTEAALGTVAIDWTRNRPADTRHAQLRLAGSRLDRYLGALEPDVLGRAALAGFGLGRYRFLGESFIRSPASAQRATGGAVPGHLPEGGNVGSPFGPAGEGVFFTEGTPQIANWTRSDFMGADALAELYTSAGAITRAGLSGRLFRVESYERTNAALPGSTFRYESFNPITFAAFAETQWGTSDDLRVQLGVRLEGFRSGLPMRSSALDSLPSTLRAGLKLAFTPRLGAAIPVPGTGGRTMARFNFGRLAQPPDFQYFLDTTLGDSLRASIRRHGNPNLSFETGNSYELGITHLLTARLSASVTGFRKTLENLVSGDIAYGGASDPTFSLADHGNVKGVELALRGRWPGLSLRAGYALQKAVGVSSVALGDTVIGSEETRVVFPLAFDRRHALNLAALAGRSAGGPFRWGAALAINAQSGYPLDRKLQPTAGAPGRPAYLPWTSDVALRASFELGALPGCRSCRWQLTADARNLFGVENVLALRRDSGLLGPTLEAFTSVEQALPVPTSAIPLESPRYSRTIDLNGDSSISPDEFRLARFAATLDRFDPSLYYGEPRQLRAGVEVSF